MTTKKMWLGTAEHYVQVPCPDSGLDMGAEGWQTSGTYLNGGAYQRSSQTSHVTYSVTWSMISDEDAGRIMDVARGAYGSGLVYMQEAFTTSNVLPYHVSVPRLQADDAPSMLPFGLRPTKTQTFGNTQDFPSQSAVFTVNGAWSVDDMPKIYVPNPGGEVLYVTAYGSATGTAELRIRPVGVTGADVSVPVLPTTTGMGIGLTGGGNAEAYELFLAGNGTLTLAGIVAMKSSAISANYNKPFISGRGSSGLRFIGLPRKAGYSAPQAKDFVTVTATLTETGAWEE